MRRRFSAACLAVAVAVAVSAPLTTPPSAPANSTTTALGDTVAHALALDSLRGRVVYVDFWASWCAPCRSSFPWMDGLHKRYADAGLTIIAVNVDHDREKAEAFLEKTHPSFRIVLDGGAKLAAACDLQGMPSSFLFSRDGTLQFSYVGFHGRDGEKIAAEISRLLDDTFVELKD